MRLAAGALILLAACGGRADRLDAAFHVADSLRAEGRQAQAGPILRVLRDSFAVAHDTAGLWRAELWWGDALLNQGRIDSARRALDAALALSAPDADREGWVRSERSLLFDRLAKFDSATVEAMRARQLALLTHDRTLEANTYNEMGRIQSLEGHYGAALAANTRALAIKRAVGGERSPGVSTEYNELGISYRHLGRFTDAEQAFGRSLAIEREHGNPEGIARATFNLANVYVATGDDGKALPLMLDALRTVEPTGNVRGEVFLHSDLGELYTRAGNDAAARTHIDSALALNHGVNAYSRVELLVALARLELARQHAGAAIVLLDSARRSADSLGLGRQRVSSRASLARGEIALGNARVAARWAAGAVTIADSLDDPEAQVEARESYGASLEAAEARGALDQYRATIALLESWRGRVALGDLRMGVAEPRLESYEGAIRILVASGRSGEAFDVAEHARARLLLDLMHDHDAGGVPERGRGPGPLPIATVQAQLITPERAMLALFWGERDVYGWWITRGSVRGARLGGADSLTMMMEFLRGAITDTSRRVPWKPAARRAFASLVAPLAPGAANEVLVIADGPLAYVPVEVLIPTGDSLPWGATRRIVYGPSASVLAVLAQAPVRARAERGVLAIANPSFAAPHEELPYAVGEAKGIAAQFTGERSDVLVGREATLARWRALGPGEYRYLHFAAHATLSGGRPGVVSVRLADGELDLAAIRQMDLAADLVTLSACETALGFEVRGEGIVGLSHAFLAAGAKGTVVTLWPIKDRSAAEFMGEFYRELNRGAAPAAAIMTVRRRWIVSRDKRADPARWAAYVLVGGLNGKRHDVSRD